MGPMNRSRTSSHLGCSLLMVVLNRFGKTLILTLQRKDIFLTWQRQTPNQIPKV